MLASLLLSMAVDAEVANGLRNLAQMHQIALAVEMTRSSGQNAPADLPPDMWGTPYRIEGERITSAGSDKKFEEAAAKGGQFAGTAGDVVFVKGEVFRSNRNWLHAHVKTDADKEALAQLGESELTFMRMRMPLMRDLTLARMTMVAMQRGQMEHDAWGTKFRVDGDRLISAGADKKFDPESWKREPTLDAAEDMIVERGKVVRAVDAQTAIREKLGPITPIEQPVDERLTVKYRVADNDGVPKPVSIHRPEPVFPGAYRRARIRGIVMLEVAISKEGKVEDVRLLKSHAPGLDASALEAVRQWTFEPVQFEGKAIPVIYILPVAFMLH